MNVQKDFHNANNKQEMRTMNRHPVQQQRHHLIIEQQLQQQKPEQVIKEYFNVQLVKPTQRRRKHSSAPSHSLFCSLLLLIITITSSSLSSLLLPCEGKSSSTSSKYSSTNIHHKHNQKKQKQKQKHNQHHDTNQHPYHALARAIFPRLQRDMEDGDSNGKVGNTKLDIKRVERALSSLSSSQATLKRIDGASHELYRRTHTYSHQEEDSYNEYDDDLDDHDYNYDHDHDHDHDHQGGYHSKAALTKKSSLTRVAGRASRAAARMGGCADALWGCELCELVECPHILSKEEEEQQHQQSTTHTTHTNGSYNNCHSHNKTYLEGNRSVWYNDTITIPPSQKRKHDYDIDIQMPELRVLVLLDESYNGGAGRDHGGIDGILYASSSQQQQQQHQQHPNGDENPKDNDDRKQPRGRILILLADAHSHSLSQTLSFLDTQSEYLELQAGLISNEVASLHGSLWKLAGHLLSTIHPVLHDMEQYLKTRYDYNTKTTHNATTTTTTTTTTCDNEEKDNQNNDQDDTTTFKTKSSSTLSSKPTKASIQKPAIHLVGRSLAGGVATLASAILDGIIPMPITTTTTTTTTTTKRTKKSKKKNTKKYHSQPSPSTISQNSSLPTKNTTKTNTKTTTTIPTLHGYGKGRTSALTLGCPPCLSPNIKATFITSIIHGDDVIPRTTQKSISKLCDRAQRQLSQNILSKKVGWTTMTDMLSLTVSNLKQHAHGSEGEELRLALPGRVYLVRPRRLDDASSIHEVGDGSGSVGSAGTREALRAAVLWQLNDILLSQSLWVHHGLDSYIHGLDRVQLREVVGGK